MAFFAYMLCVKQFLLTRINMIGNLSFEKWFTGLQNSSLKETYVLYLITGGFAFRIFAADLLHFIFSMRSYISLKQSLLSSFKTVRMFSFTQLNQ
jgi:hypothetical protein